MRPFGEAKSISGHQTLQLMKRPYDSPLGQSREEATWEDANVIKGQYLDTSLEDKTLLEGGSNDTDPSKLIQSLPKLKVWNGAATFGKISYQVLSPSRCSGGGKLEIMEKSMDNSCSGKEGGDKAVQGRRRRKSKIYKRKDEDKSRIEKELVDQSSNFHIKLYKRSLVEGTKGVPDWNENHHEASRGRRLLELVAESVAAIADVVENEELQLLLVRNRRDKQGKPEAEEIDPPTRRTPTLIWAKGNTNIVAPVLVGGPLLRPPRTSGISKYCEEREKSGIDDDRFCLQKTLKTDPPCCSASLGLVYKTKNSKSDLGFCNLASVERPKVEGGKMDGWIERESSLENGSLAWWFLFDSLVTD
ncbi:hypothetical protein Ccrd_008200 [Cynara cardunculus var. scolymus]|uniref:Uncharacterized protein n=1 Tax=Cynara cardunculus var. scolymus TaxID=59895 RepID=A0A103XFJ1_CYNCS|nr:hypothetical protein Ccrd_008200 [Cynara cardunculus var. scolymus]